MGKIPLTPDITSAILAAETGKLCDNPQEHISGMVSIQPIKCIKHYLSILLMSI
ncbi:hypothetical protein ACP8HZ_11275 [Francisella noatunensis]